MSHDAGWGPQGPPPYGQGVPPYGGVPPGGFGWMPPLPPKPGVIPLGPPLDLGKILGGAFGTLGRCWTHLLAVGSALYGGLLVLMGVVAGTGYLIFKSAVDEMVDQETFSPDGTSVGAAVAVGILLWLLFIVLVLYITGVLTALVYVLLEPSVVGQRLTVREAWRRAHSRAWACVGTALLTGLIVMVPVIAAVVVIVILAATVGQSSVGLVVLLGILLGLGALGYAVWMGIRLSMGPVAVVLEAASPVTALRRSAQLVRGSWWRIFGIMLLGYLIASVASQVVQIPLQIILPLAGIGLGTSDSAEAGLVVVLLLMLLVMAVSMIASVFVNAFMQLVIGVLYVDRRIRTEGLAPALLEAAGVAAAPPQDPPYPYGGAPGRHA
ncbi:DUF7544 domain-containing protein [Streptomyces smaragdinus]|uniref:DUF7544 domain-containing protein n=1 Tax=Streptomyces smaragdinus TaxID=2585196 RepID=UPI001297E224|nr:hypothetical protein [Streptomyces smaragdinus]